MPQTKELHLFMPIGDDEIQVESWDKKLNKEVLKLHKDEPDAVVILYDDDAPAFLRAAVKFENVTLSFHPKAEPKKLTEAQKNARSENGRKHKSNLKTNKIENNESNSILFFCNTLILFYKSTINTIL